PEPEPECTGTEEQKVSFVDCSTERWRRCKNGKWEEFNKTVISTDCRHNCGKPDDETKDCEEGTTGTQTRTYTCNQSTGSWEAGAWQGECTEVEECEAGGEEISYFDGITDTCNGDEGEPFTCPSDLSEKLTCIDVYSPTTTGGVSSYLCNPHCKSDEECVNSIDPWGRPAKPPRYHCVDKESLGGGQQGAYGGGAIAFDSRVHYVNVTCCP
ncbi:MAG: hypothetical protein II913_05005, partial [Elusimicrobiaceae bacterium]|nr:hypothetical protein [Elusimicrobiaceae bacterium]